MKNYIKFSIFRAEHTIININSLNDRYNNSLYIMNIIFNKTKQPRHNYYYCQERGNALLFVYNLHL